VWEDERDDPAGHQYVLQHGTTLHGLQFVDQAKHLLPTAYYGRSSGAGLAIANFPREVKRRIGAVGLGVGTIAAYGKEGDYFRFYEINPEVKRLAETQFTYLANCAAEVDVIIGDARLSMENEAGQEFDVLILDAFSSAAVPVHLLTKEAFEIYLTHIKPDGVIAVHTSNLHIDLDSVVWKAAEHFKLKSAWIESSESGKKGTLASDWILLTSNEEFLRQRAILRKASEPEGDFSRLDLWTDERVNLFQVLK
jgi:spermidine synthase